jgi:hypothetical protein
VVARDGGWSTDVLLTLPLADLILGHPPEDVTLVVDAKESGREPPLDRSTDRRAAAPTVWLAAAHEIPRIVNSLD